jgi:hypothetical protein
LDRLNAFISPRGRYVVQCRFGFAVSHAAGRYSYLATQQELGLLPQRQFGFGVVDYFGAVVRGPNLIVTISF